MPMGFKSTGNTKNIEKFMQRMSKRDIFRVLDSYGLKGVDVLSNATPVDTGLASRSWGYEIVRKPGEYTIAWTNSNVEDDRQVVILIQYGHATTGGTFVQGRDFINPAIRPIFDKMADEIWRQVIQR